MRNLVCIAFLLAFLLPAQAPAETAESEAQEFALAIGDVIGAAKTCGVESSRLDSITTKVLKVIDRGALNEIDRVEAEVLFYRRMAEADALLGDPEDQATRLTLAILCSDALERFEIYERVLSRH